MEKFGGSETVCDSASPCWVGTSRHPLGRGFGKCSVLSVPVSYTSALHHRRNDTVRGCCSQSLLRVEKLRPRAYLWVELISGFGYSRDLAMWKGFLVNDIYALIRWVNGWEIQYNQGSPDKQMGCLSIIYMYLSSIAIYHLSFYHAQERIGSHIMEVGKFKIWRQATWRLWIDLCCIPSPKSIWLDSFLLGRKQLFFY